MTVDNSFTMKKFQSMEIIYVTFSQITKLPYVECDPETFDDQVYMFTEEEAAKEFAKSYVEKNTPLLTVKVLRKQMPNFYMGLYAEGVNMVIFHEGDQTRRIELEQIFPKPDMEIMNKQHLPVLNPGVQLTVVYFLQELRKPNQRRDDAERMQHLRELEEEMLVNLMRSKFILAIDISHTRSHRESVLKSVLRCLSVPFIFPQKLSVLPFFCLFFIIPFSRRKRNRIAHRKKREQNHRFSSGNSSRIFLSLISAQFFSAFFGCTASQIKSPPAHRESSPKFQSWTALLPPV